MRCPSCKLHNPPRAQRCDCGYDFTKQEGPGPSVPAQRSSLAYAVTWLGVGGGLGTYGDSLLAQAGPCTIHLGFGGLALMAVGGVAALIGAVHVVGFVRRAFV